MKLELNNYDEGVNWERVAEIFSLVGWGTRQPEEIKAAFGKSSFVRFAYADGLLVGFGRTVDDGQYYALIADLIVHPDYQNRGIGSRILYELEKSLTTYAFTTLTSVAGKEAFYTRHGWLKQTTSFIWPRSEKQKWENT
jgi:GNAT superfamily N-acetyltransferase